jgi:pimeloyl-ACP methyl ester carboxylesterase
MLGSNSKPLWSWIMRLRVLGALLMIATPAAQAPRVEKEWLGTTGQRTRAALFRSTDAGYSPILVVVLHGDLGGASGLASNAASQIHGIIAVALVRPGYTDGDGDTSDGVKGNATGDNYTPEVLNQLDAAARRLKIQLHPSGVVLVGHSGGAAISADLIARDNGLARAALLLSCPCDVPTWRKHMKTLRPTPLWDEPVTSISPISVVDEIGSKTQIWMMVGEKDDTAPPEYTERYAAALRKHGIEPRVTVLPGRDHNIIFDSTVIQQLSALVAQLR